MALFNRYRAVEQGFVHLTRLILTARLTTKSSRDRRRRGPKPVKPYRLGVLFGHNTIHAGGPTRARSAELVIDDLYLRKFVTGTLLAQKLLVPWFPILIKRRNDEITIVAAAQQRNASSVEQLWWIRGYVETFQSKRTGCRVTLDLRVV